MLSNLNRRQWSLCSKLKCGVLPLAVETGRFKNIDRELRVCRVCNSGAVEIEYHHLLECKGLENVRKVYETDFLDDIKKDYKANKDIIKCMFQKNRLKVTGKYLQDLTEARNEMIY